MTPDDIALDFMTESEIAEIIATEDIFQVDLTRLDDLLEDVASDSDYEQQLDSPRWRIIAGSIPAVGAWRRTSRGVILMSKQPTPEQVYKMLTQISV